MTDPVMSPEAIAALVEAAKDGRQAEDAPGPARRRRVHTVDFSRPTKFTADQERRIKRSLEAFCRTATSRLSAELRVPFELEVINASQLTWANAHAQVPDGSLTALVRVKPIGTRMLLAGDSQLLLGAIEMLVGGIDPSAVRPRRLTDIDWALANHFFERLLAQMSLIWTDMFDLELEVENIDQHLETAQSAPVSEPSLALTVEARLDGGSSALVLLVPWRAIESVIDRFSGRDEQATVGHGEALAVRRAVAGVHVPIRAEVASVTVPIEEVLALQPGDVLDLKSPADQGVTVYADKVPVHRGTPGRNGGRRAVQITGRTRPGGAS